MKAFLAIICCLVAAAIASLLTESSLEQYILNECENGGFVKLHDHYVACDVLKLNETGSYYEIGE